MQQKVERGNCAEKEALNMQAANAAAAVNEMKKNRKIVQSDDPNVLYEDSYCRLTKTQLTIFW